MWSHMGPDDAHRYIYLMREIVSQQLPEDSIRELLLLLHVPDYQRGRNTHSSMNKSGNIFTV